MSAEKQGIDPWARRFSPEAGHLGDTRGDVMAAMEGAIAVYEGEGQSLENYVRTELMRPPGDYPLWSYHAGYISNDEYFAIRRKEEVAWVASKLLGGGEQANKVWNSALQTNLAPDVKQSATRSLIALFFPDAASKSRQLFTGIVALEAMRARVLHLGENLPSPPSAENREKMIDEALNWADGYLFLVNNDQTWDILGNDSLFYLAFAMTKRFIGENQPLPAAELLPPEEPAQATAADTSPSEVPAPEPATPADETEEALARLRERIDGHVEDLAGFFYTAGVPPEKAGDIKAAFAHILAEIASLKKGKETAVFPEIEKQIGRFFQICVSNLVAAKETTFQYLIAARAGKPMRNMEIHPGEVMIERGCLNTFETTSSGPHVFLVNSMVGEDLVGRMAARINPEVDLDLTVLSLQTGLPLVAAARVLNAFMCENIPGFFVDYADPKYGGYTGAEAAEKRNKATLKEAETVLGAGVMKAVNYVVSQKLRGPANDSNFRDAIEALRRVDQAELVRRTKVGKG